MAFNFETAEAIVREESEQKELLIYLAIGCALGRYAPGEHPAQQNPPYLKAFHCHKICILIDPCLEMPPRATKDPIEDTLFMPIQQEFEYYSQFLKNLIEICTDPLLCVKMILHDFTGKDSNQYYLAHFKDKDKANLFKNVLFDPMYGDGDCCPDLNKVNILRNSSGFIQPKYSRLQDLQKINKDVLISELKMRKYSVDLIARMYRIHEDLEEIRDWCTDKIIQEHYVRFCIIYNICYMGEETRLKEILMKIVEDLCVVAETFLSEEEIMGILSSSKSLENLWKMVGTILVHP
jgi:hypothetical protein